MKSSTVTYFSNNATLESMDAHYRQQPWYQFLDQQMQSLVDQSVRLLADEKGHKKERFRDYGFLVFPIARAYEGYLKKFFEHIGLIDQFQLENPHFRIGRSLNPDLPDRFRDEDWLYDDLFMMYAKCNHPGLAERMWQVWRQGRNQIFHYYFNSSEAVPELDLDRAAQLIHDFAEVMQQAIDCHKNHHEGEAGGMGG